MSDLQTFGAHARAMSTAQHKPECEGSPVCIYSGIKPRARCTWNCADGCASSFKPSPDPDCPGCVTDADRALWARLADEVDAYLTTEPEEMLL